MITVTTGTRLILDVDGSHTGLRASVEYVDNEVMSVLIDAGQPPSPVSRGTRATITVAADSGPTHLAVQIHDSERGGRRVRLVRPSDLTGRDRRASDRILVDRPLMWAQLNDNGQMATQRHGIARDISLSGLCFETLSNPPKVGSIVAVTSGDGDAAETDLARVVGLDDSPPQQLRHVVRCSLQIVTTAGLRPLKERLASS